jgi:hypothetical protein
MNRLISLCVFVVISLFSHSGNSSTFSSEPERTLTEPEKEFYGAMSIYEGYVGRRPEQIANMLGLTIVRVERASQMLQESGKEDPQLASEIESTLHFLLSRKHMSLADAHFAKGDMQSGYQEVGLACRHAAIAPQLVDDAIKQICKRNDKSTI